MLLLPCYVILKNKVGLNKTSKSLAVVLPSVIVPDIVPIVPVELTDTFKLAEDNFVFEELIEDFQDWFYMYCIDHPEDTYAAALPDDSTLIDDWWDWVQDFYKDEYNSPYDIDPTPDGDSPYSDAEYIITP